MRLVVSEAPAPTPMGCVCAYTWSAFARRQVRNGPRADCGADHTAVDRAGAREFAVDVQLPYGGGGVLPPGFSLVGGSEPAVPVGPG